MKFIKYYDDDGATFVNSGFLVSESEKEIIEKFFLFPDKDINLIRKFRPGDVFYFFDDLLPNKKNTFAFSRAKVKTFIKNKNSKGFFINETKKIEKASIIILNIQENTKLGESIDIEDEESFFKQFNLTEIIRSRGIFTEPALINFINDNFSEYFYNLDSNICDQIFNLNGHTTPYLLTVRMHKDNLSTGFNNQYKKFTKYFKGHLVHSLTSQTLNILEELLTLKKNNKNLKDLAFIPSGSAKTEFLELKEKFSRKEAEELVSLTENNQTALALNLLNQYNFEDETAKHHYKNKYWREYYFYKTAKYKNLKALEKAAIDVFKKETNFEVHSSFLQLYTEEVEQVFKAVSQKQPTLVNLDNITITANHEIIKNMNIYGNYNFETKQ